jgi:hypothetical protein
LTSICDFIQPDRLPPDERSARFAVPPCDILALNTVQQSGRDPRRYLAVVSREVALIRSVSPSVAIIAGVSSNPAGPPVPASTLARDMGEVASLVQGFWLNVPAPGVGCPRCRAPQPQVMTQALALFGRRDRALTR